MAALWRSRPSPWARCATLAGLALSIRCLPVSTGLEVLETVVDRDDGVLVVEDILEGFGRVPVSVVFSPTSSHMFIGFKAGQVRIYPDGGDTLLAANYDSCVDMEPDVYENNDLGLLNFQLHPEWPTVPYGYMVYTHDPGFDDDCLVEPFFCEKDHRLVRVEVDFDEATGTVTCGAQEILINDWCTGSNHHGGGGMDFLPNGDMVMAVGDMSKADQRDPGDQEENTCLREGVGLPQGNFRAIMDDFNEGKMLRISAEALVMPALGDASTTGFLVRDTDFWLEAKGFRNPFRLTVVPGSGDVIIADVGLDTAESMKVVPNPITTAAATTIPNYGWPCIEGDAWIPPYAAQWLEDNKSDACDAVRDTTLGSPLDVDYDALKTKALNGGVDWVPPAFVYLDGVIDAEYPEFCANTQSSVSALHIYRGAHLPERYHNRLFVGDYSKDCAFYFDVEDGVVDWTTPHVLFENRAIVDFNTDPKTGIMYAIDAKFSILIKITATDGPTSSVMPSTSSASLSASGGPTVLLEADVLEGPVPLTVTLDASGSSDPEGIMLLEWDCDGDGVFEAESDWTVPATRTHTCTYTVGGTYEPSVRATNSLDASTVQSLEILAGEVVVDETPAPSATVTEAPVVTAAPVAPPLGDSVTSPPELEWTLNEATGVYAGEIDMGVVTIDNFYGQTTTRGFNGQIPGPTIRMEACKTYELTYTNNLEGPNPGGEWNHMKDPNTTNIHTHGLHISGESPADDVLFVEINPGESHTYVYTLPCDHAGGTFWYHPHHHGSTSLQMGGGAMGALIVEDRVDVHGIPDQIADMPEFVMTIQEMNPDLTALDRDASGDELHMTTATQTHYLVNGQVMPTIPVVTGTWVRLRMAFAGHGDNHAISLLAPEGTCEMAVLAKDGVYLGEVPRIEPKLFFTPASRVDVAVRCIVAGDFELRIESERSIETTMPLAGIYVEGGSNSIEDDLETWMPCRPYYLQDLVDEPFEQDDTLGLLVRDTIGGEYYSGPNNYVVNMTVGEIQEWNLQGSEGHPFHMHVNHVQFKNVDGPSLVPGWNQVGDWVDTVSTSLAVVRFRTERYGGHVAMHCHVNSHSDTGIMAVADIAGGEGPNEDPVALAAGTCGSASVDGFGYNLDTASSPSSSGGDRSFGGNDSVDLEDTWWVAAAAGAGVGLAVVLIGAVLFTKFRKKSGSGAGRPAVQPSDKRRGGFADETKAEPF
eukprot:g13031.t1